MTDKLKMHDGYANTEVRYMRSTLSDAEFSGKTLGISDIWTKAHVITVHGTFAHAAKWAQPNSTLAHSIIQWFAERNIDATIVPFTWSGKNLIEARRSAGDDLLDLLDRVRIDYPQSTIFIIAHSHGGSVVAYALKKRPEAIKEIAGFVALATPWIGITTSSFAVQLRSLLIKFITYVLFFVGAELLLPLLIVSPIYEAIVGHHKWGWVVELEISVFAIAVASILFAISQRMLSCRFQRSASLFHEKLLAFADRVSTLHTLLPPSVFLKSVGDEAVLTLTWASAMAVLMQWASAVLFLFLQSLRLNCLRTPVWVRVSGGSVLMAVWSVGTFWLILMRDELTFRSFPVYALSQLMNTSFDWVALSLNLTVVFAAFAWVILVLILIPLIFLLAIGFLSGTGFGSPSLRTALFFKLSVEPVPAGEHRLVLLEESTDQAHLDTIRWSGLSHSSLHKDPAAIHAILGAFSAFHQNPEPHPIVVVKT
ncbi:MAG: serine aminopeptidase domain-containing protein [Syntrophobacteraceae bacterium]